MTQEDVANALGITGVAVALWESGKNRPRLDKLNQLARLLGVVVWFQSLRDVC